MSYIIVHPAYGIFIGYRYSIRLWSVKDNDMGIHWDHFDAFDTRTKAEEVIKEWVDENNEKNYHILNVGKIKNSKRISIEEFEEKSDVITNILTMLYLTILQLRNRKKTSKDL